MARRFNGSSDYLSRSGAIVGAYPFTFACWAAPSSAGNLFSLGNTGDSGHYVRSFVNTATGAMAFTVVNPTDGFVSYSSTIPGFAAGEILPLAVVAASTTSRATYARGASIGTGSTSVAFPTLNVTTLGCLQRTSMSEFIGGVLAHAAFWSAALSAAEIASLAAGASPLQIRPASLTAYWPLRGLACDAPEPGVTSSGRDLTVVGTSWAQDPPNVWSPQLQVEDGLPWYAPVAGASPAPGGGSSARTLLGDARIFSGFLGA